MIFLVSYILTKASVTIFAGAFAIQTILGYDVISVPLFGEVDFFWFAAMSLVIVTGVFVVLGGMKSVLWTEAMHVPVLLIGSAVLLIVGLYQIGGLDALRAANPETIHLWRPLSTTAGNPGISRAFCSIPSATPWLGVLLTSPIIGLWYWCTDQYIVQRVLTARNLKEARRGTMFAGYLKLAPVFIFLLPGMIAVALWKQGTPGFEAIETNPQGAFPILVSNLLPVGLKGLVLAGMLSALMSALASLFNSTATLFTVDFYKRLRPQSTREASGERGPPRHRRRHRARHGVDSVPAGSRQGPALHLPAARAVAARAVDRGGVHGGHLLQYRDAEIRPRRHRHGLRPRHDAVSSSRRRTRCTASSGRASSRTSST